MGSKSFKQQLREARDEATRLIADKEYLTNFLKSVNAKLGNALFVKNAKPEIIANENAKKYDAEARIKVIDDILSPKVKETFRKKISEF